ncbi:hypothetical protein FI667_g2520, partial [Globisporangium splendens]
MFMDVVGDDEVDYEESDEMRSGDDDHSPPRASTPAVNRPRLQPAQSSGTLAVAIRASSTPVTHARLTPSSSVRAASPAVRVKPEARAGMTVSPVVAADEGPLPGLTDDGFVHEMRFDPRTDDRNRFYIDLFYQYRYHNLKRSNAGTVLLQAWNAFVKNYNDDTQGFVRRLRSARERYERHSFRGKLNRIHSECMHAGIPCGVPKGLECAFCAPGAERISPERLVGYKNFVVPHAVKDLIYGVLDSSYHELAESSCAPGSLARSSAARLVRPPAAVEAAERRPSCSSRTQPSAAGLATSIRELEPIVGQLFREVREHAVAVVGFREENRRILMSQVSASERVER